MVSMPNESSSCEVPVLPHSHTITVKRDKNIVEEEADVIVNAANSKLMLSATPKLNFGSTNTPSLGGTIFGTQSTVQLPFLGGSGQVFQFSGSQQQSTGPVQFTADKELLFGDCPPANPFFKGREIKKAKRRMK